MLIALAWKNVWRNKRRSLIVLAAIALGLWGGLFATGLMLGFGETYVSSAIDRDISHCQIHTPAFKEDELLADVIPGADALVAAIRRLSPVREVSPRMIVGAMASSAASSNMVRLYGVDPAAERNVTSIQKQIKEGVYLDGAGRMSVVVGETLAKKLALRLRSKLVLSMQGIDGSIVYGGFRVSGIFRTESTVFDGATIFVRREDLGGLVGTGLCAHEIAIRLSESGAVEEAVDSMRALARALAPASGLAVEGWKELAPELRITAESTGVTMQIFVGVILFALLFGITNTMLMSVLDRVREFGVLMAVGMRRRRLFGLIVTETILLALTGAAAGILLGGSTVWLLSLNGIDLSWFSDGLAYYGLPVILYPVLPLSVYPGVVGMVIATAVLAATYPAIKAIRLKPARAIRTYG